MKVPPAEEHAWSDSDDRYGRDYDYEEHWSRGPPPPPMRQMPENRGFPPMYGPPMIPNVSRDGRFMHHPPPPPPPPHPNYGYMNYDHRQVPPPPPPLVPVCAKIFLLHNFVFHVDINKK